jgi:hypothetical protein
MTPRLRKCDESTIAGRLAKAEQFLEGVEIIREFAADEQDTADAYVTLCGGIRKASESARPGAGERCPHRGDLCRAS